MAKSQIELVNACSFPRAELNRGAVDANANSWLFCIELDMLHNSHYIVTKTASDQINHYSKSVKCSRCTVCM